MAIPDPILVPWQAWPTSLNFSHPALDLDNQTVLSQVYLLAAIDVMRAPRAFVSPAHSTVYLVYVWVPGLADLLTLEDSRRGTFVCVHDDGL